MTLSLLVALWLSLLQALAGTPATPPHAAADWRGDARAESSVLRSEPGWARDALRVPRVVTGIVSATGESPARHPTPAAPLEAPARPADGPRGVALVRVRALRTSHAAAARGAVLPYFATAPPLQG